MRVPTPSSPSRASIPACASEIDAVPGASGRPTYRFPVGLGIWIAAKIVAIVLWVLGCHVAAVVTYLIPDPWLFWQIVVPPARGFGPVVSRFRATSRVVWLTIDDGPDPVTTPEVLNLLDRHRARATFFVIGENVRRYPELAREIARRGHQLANHTATHPAHSLWRAGSARFAREVDLCRTALADAGIAPAPYFRAPVGIKSVFMHPHLSRRGYSLVAWSARGFDSILSETTATKRILKSLRPGVIILTHEGRGELSRVRVLERVLAGIAEAGFTTVIPDRSALIED